MTSLLSGQALLLADARLPVGAHTQSGALEPALLCGPPGLDVPAFLRLRLATSIPVEAATAVVTLAQTDRAGPDRIGEIEAAWAARNPSQVVRAASVEAGRGYLRLLDRLRPLDVRRPARPRPIAMALLAAELGVECSELARVVCHDEVQTVCAAALKLVPGDPHDAVAWALSVRAEVEEVVTSVAGITDPEDIPAGAAPALESWQHTHQHAPRRLFRA